MALAKMDDETGQRVVFHIREVVDDSQADLTVGQKIAVMDSSAVGPRPRQEWSGRPQVSVAR